MISAVLVLVTIYFIAPLFEALPLCVLASIVVVASIPLFVHYTMWRKYWRTDSYDFAIWLVSFCGTFVAGVDYGMIVGVAYRHRHVTVKKCLYRCTVKKYLTTRDKRSVVRVTSGQV